MGFTSLDDMLTQLTVNGKKWRTDWNKIVPTVNTAGRWYDLFLGAGSSGQGYHGNYVRNWGFDSVAEWGGFGAGGWAWNVAGTAVHTAGTGGNLTQTSGTTIEAATTYTVIVTSSSIGGSGGFQIDIGGVSGTGITTNTTTVQAITTNGAPTQVISIIPNSACTVTIDNLIIIAGGTNGQSPRFMPYSANTVTGAFNSGAVTGGAGTTKHLLNMSALTAGATTVPCTLMLIDLLGCYARVDANTGNAISFGNSLTLPRWTNGAGVRAFSVVAPTTLGSTAHNFVASYTNQAGTSGRNFPQTVAGTVSAVNSHISHSGTAANNIGPFLPLQSGDTGVRSIEQWQQTAAGGTASTFQNIVLCKPLMTIPVTTQYLLAERDLLNQFPSLPLVQEAGATTGACLSWLIYAGAATPANTNFYGALEFGWGG